MQITLSPELEALINRRIASGDFSTPSDVIKEGLMLLDAQEQFLKKSFSEIKSKIDVAIRESELGLCEPFDVEEIKREGRRILKERKGR